MDWVKTTARRDEKHLSFQILCDLYQRFYGTYILNTFLQATRVTSILRYEDLLREEHITVQELAALERRMETWSQMAAAPVHKATAKTTVPLASHRDITKDLPPEVASFEVQFINDCGVILI